MALESARNIDVVLFDKTGTLTKGEQAVIDLWPVGSTDENQLLKIAASVEQTSEHSLGKAIVKAAQQKNIALEKVERFKAIAGRGVEAVIASNQIAVGGPRLLQARDLIYPEALEDKIRQADNDGKTVIYVLENDRIIGAITVADVIREESRLAVHHLKTMGVRVAMITGDSEGVASYVARKLKLDEYFAEVLPEHKADKVKELQGKGDRVAMVGDGVNDAPALTQADLGIAVGAGTDVAIESAGIVLVKSNPLDIPKIVYLSRRTYRKMVQNLFWATGYNVIAIPLAAGVLASFGIILAPAIGAVFMSLSTVVVALNAQLLRKIDLQ
jgi:Cu2+-exporting ATPase